MKLIKQVTILAATALCLLAHAAIADAPRIQGPPLYAVERGDSKVYLFGVAGPSDRKWLTPTVSAALGEMTELWQENPASPPSFDPKLMTELGSRSSGSLFDDLTDAEAARVMHLAQSLGITREQLAPLKPSAAAALFQTKFFQKLAAGPRLDDVAGFIQKTAQDKGLPVKSEFPTWDDFPRFTAALPQKAQVQWLLYQLDFLEKPLPQAWSDAWENGDVSGFEGQEREMFKNYPELYAVIGPARNQKWADRIEQMLKEPGAHFIAIGLLHTLGPESVQVQLARRGIHMHRA